MKIYISPYLVIILILICIVVEAQDKTTIQANQLYSNKSLLEPGYKQVWDNKSQSSFYPSKRVNPIGPDLILFNANVLTMDDQIPNAQAIAIEGNLISAVGTNVDILALQMAGTELIDLQSRTVVPGLIEDHSHRINDGFYCDGPEGLVRATETMAANGYTTVYELFGDPSFIQCAQTLAQNGRLAVRINAYIPYNSACGDDIIPWMTYPYTVNTDTTFRIVGVKIFADGGSCGCPAITSFYQGDAVNRCGDHGHLFKTQTEMNLAVSEVLTAGYPIAIHAIGDWGIEVGLNAFENAFAGGGNILRCRMDHLRVMREDLANQMSALGIGASIQYTWASASNAPAMETTYESHVLNWVYPWRQLANRSIKILGGNDSPWAARSQAMQTISFLATRKKQSYDVVPGWMNSNQLTVQEGLQGMTVNNSWIAFEDSVKGTITVGKFADLTVLSADPLTVNPFDVRYIAIEMTIMDGIIRYNKIDIDHTAVHNSGIFNMGIDDRGLWGPFRSNVGMLYNGYEHLWQGSVLISYDSSTVGNASPVQQDFKVTDDGSVHLQEPGIVADEEITVEYFDAADQHPGTIEINQKTFMWNSDSLLLVKYRFTNISDEQISDLYLGQLLDYDIGSYSTNMGSWDQNDGLGFAYMYDSDDPNTAYFGIAMFDDTGVAVNSALAFKSSSRIAPHNEHAFSTVMRSNIIESGTVNPGDYSMVIARGPFSIDINQSIEPFILAFVAGDNVEDLRNAVNKANNRVIMGLVNKTIPEYYELCPNFPNPFNPVTTIEYDLPQRSEVQITIFDILGRKVTTLVSETQDAGYKSIQWDATNVPSGMYFYQIRANDHLQTRKMILLK